MSECVNPVEIQEGDLMAYVDGEADERVANHIRRCTFCAQRAQDYERTQGRLVALLYRASCPSPETLGDFYLNVLHPGQKLMVARHLRECPHCARELREYSVSPHESALTGFMERLRGTITGVVEAMLIPPRPQPVALRGRTAHQRVYRADGLSIHIGYQPSAGPRGMLAGLIHPSEQQCPTSLAGIQVGLFQQNEPIGIEPLNELGHFVFQDIPPGEYDLAFDWQGKMVLISGIEVR